MRLIKWLAIVMAVLVIGVVAVGFVLPDTAHVERSIVVATKPATAYTALNGFKQFNKWSPWANLDPNAEYTLEGPLMGVGAKSSWRSEDPNVGAGSQEILEATPYEQIRMRLVFEGFDSENYSAYQFAPEGEGTRITWSYDTTFHGNLINRYFGLMLDKMIGADYEKGLAQLKTLLESLPQDDLAGMPIALVAVESKPMAYISGQTTAALSENALDGAYQQLRAYFSAHQLNAAEPPIAITRHFDDVTKLWNFDAALVPLQAALPEPNGNGIRLGRTYGGQVLRMEHAGAYNAMDAAYYQLIAYKTVAGLDDNGDSWEQYLSGIPANDAAQPVAHIYWPVR